VQNGGSGLEVLKARHTARDVGANRANNIAVPGGFLVLTPSSKQDG